MTGDVARSLTTMPEKVAAYVTDTYFLESVEQLSRLGADVESFALRHGLLFLKPDAIVARAVEPTLQWLADNGFRVVSARTVAANGHFVRSLWYFQWNIASAERRTLADLLLNVSSSLLLVVTDAADELPTSVRLTERKGPTAPSKRQPGHLRHLLGGGTYLLNMVHTPDDPADVVRELGIYFTEHERRVVIGEALTGIDRSAVAKHLGQQLYETVEAGSFERSDAEAALKKQLRSGEELPQRLQEKARLVLEGDTVPNAAWAELLTTAWDVEWPLDPWPVLVVGSAVLPMRTATGTQILGAADPADWRARMGGQS